MKNARVFCLVVLFALVVTLTGRSTPAIIPLPVTMQVRSGTFTLCPNTTPATLSTRATTTILVDPSSGATGQYLAAMLLRSTGYQFQILTNTSTSPIRNAILLTTSNAITSLGSEGYELTVAPDSVVVRAPGQSGVFYGVQSLLQLLPPKVLSLAPATNVAWTAPCVYIQDQPQFTWRGYMMDESRHFFGKNEVKKMLDVMALQKMNTFHWHLVDDEGWRIQILAYPLLTQVGAWRNGLGTTNQTVTGQNNGIDFGQNPRVSPNTTNSAGLYGGFYTQNDIREIVAYASQRHITIVPEIEMPAHDSASLAAYPQFGCGNAQSAYRMDVTSGVNVNYGKCLLSLGTNTTIPFLQEVLTEVMGLFPGPYIHLGGDEVTGTGDTQWETYSVDSAQMSALGLSGNIVGYQHWFSTNMAAFVQANGKTMIGWTEFEAGGIVSNAVCEDWEVGGLSQATNAAAAGQKVVMAPDTKTYINYYSFTNGQQGGFPQYPPGEPFFEVGGGESTNTLANIYSFQPLPTNFPAQFASNILGGECAEWAEFIPSTLNEELRAFPRMTAMAEDTWTPTAQKNFTDFTNRLVTHEQRLTAMGINFDTGVGTNGSNSIGNATSIGTWGPTVSTNTSPATTLTYTITQYVTNAGQINLDFHYISGGNALNIYSVALFANGVQVDADTTYIGYAGPNPTPGPTLYIPGNLPYFPLILKTYQPGAVYTIQASVSGFLGSSTSGTVYIVNSD